MMIRLFAIIIPNVQNALQIATVIAIYLFVHLELACNAWKMKIAKGMEILVLKAIADVEIRQHHVPAPLLFAQWMMKMLALAFSARITMIVQAKKGHATLLQGSAWNAYSLATADHLEIPAVLQMSALVALQPDAPRTRDAFQVNAYVASSHRVVEILLFA